MSLELFRVGSFVLPDFTGPDAWATRLVGAWVNSDGSCCAVVQERERTLFDRDRESRVSDVAVHLLDEVLRPTSRFDALLDVAGGRLDVSIEPTQGGIHEVSLATPRGSLGAPTAPTSSSGPARRPVRWTAWPEGRVIEDACDSWLRLPPGRAGRVVTLTTAREPRAVYDAEARLVHRFENASWVKARVRGNTAQLVGASAHGEGGTLAVLVSKPSPNVQFVDLEGTTVGELWLPEKRKIAECTFAPGLRRLAFLTTKKELGCLLREEKGDGADLQFITKAQPALTDAYMGFVDAERLVVVTKEGELRLFHNVHESEPSCVTASTTPCRALVPCATGEFLVVGRGQVERFRIVARS